MLKAWVVILLQWKQSLLTAERGREKQEKAEKEKLTAGLVCLMAPALFSTTWPRVSKLMHNTKNVDGAEAQWR